MSMAKRILRGVEWLDEAKPGWESEIDLDWLDLEGNNTCITGQLFGSYNKLLEQFGHKSLVRYGFQLRLCAQNDVNYHKLTNFWKKLIEQRLKKGQSR